MLTNLYDPSGRGPMRSLKLLQAYFYKPAVKSNGQWNFSCSQQRLGGPRSAVPKPAFVAVTRGGKIRVLYQNKDSRLEIKGEVENIRHPTGLITHAAICQDKGSHKGKRHQGQSRDSPSKLKQIVYSSRHTAMTSSFGSIVSVSTLIQ